MTMACFIALIRHYQTRQHNASLSTDEISALPSTPPATELRCPAARMEIPRKLGFSLPRNNRLRLPSGEANHLLGAESSLSRRIMSPAIEAIISVVVRSAKAKP